MSQIFDFALAAPSIIDAGAKAGTERFHMAFQGHKGLNQITLPTFKNPSTPFNISANGTRLVPVETELDDPRMRNAPKELSYFDLVSKSSDCQFVNSQNAQESQIEAIGRTPSIAILKPRPLSKSNKAIYYLKMRTRCSNLNAVRLEFANGWILDVVGELEYYCRDIDIVRLSAKLAPGTRLEISYAQILPEKDSILQKLKRIPLNG